MTISDINLVKLTTIYAPNATDPVLLPLEYTTKGLFLRDLDIKPDFVDAIEEQKQRYIEIRQHLCLLRCQTNRLRCAEWNDNDSCIAALGVSLNIG